MGKWANKSLELGAIHLSETARDAVMGPSRSLHSTLGGRQTAAIRPPSQTLLAAPGNFTTSGPHGTIWAPLPQAIPPPLWPFPSKSLSLTAGTALADWSPAEYIEYGTMHAVCGEDT